MPQIGTGMRQVLLLGLFGLTFLAATAVAQMTTATISGTVKDASGAVLPGASVVVTNLDTGTVREVVTSDAGAYRAPNLSLGNYEVRAELPGFRTEVRKGIVLTVGRQAVVDFALQVGEISEQVVVTGEAPLVETKSSTLSGLVEGRQIADLPLNGRSLDQLISLQGGTNAVRFAGQGGVAQFSIGGQRWQSNKFYQDGVELTGGRRLNDLPGSAAGVNLGVDAIREFRVITNNFSAEHGKRMGGVVATVTKSGTNQIHGSAFFFHRNDNLDAKNFFASSELPEFRRHNYGGSIGGPIVKDKTFFFFNYEALRELLGLTQRAVVPDAAARTGILPDPVTGRLVNLGVHPAVKPYFDWWPAPNGINFGDGTAEAISARPRTTRQDFLIGRVDHQFSESDTVFGSYKFDEAQVETPQLVLTFLGVNKTRYQTVALEEKHIFSSASMNLFRVGYNRSFVLVDNVPTAALDRSLEFVQGLGFGSLELGGGTGAARTGISQAGGTGFNRIVTNFYQFTDQVHHSHGRHAFQFGVQVQRLQWNGDALDRPRGRMIFNSLDDFLINKASRYTGPTPVGVTGEIIGVKLTDPSRMRGYRQTYFATYAEDQLQLRSNLTVNLGLRYESMTAPVEVNGRLASQVMEKVTPQGYIPATVPRFGNPLFKNNSLLGFAPRIGISWDPFATGKTSVRAGAGMFYEQIEPPHYHFYNEGVPPAFLYTTVANPSFPHPFGPVLDTTGLRPDMYGVDEDIDVPTAFHFNLGVERQLAESLVVKAHYAGSTGYHLLGVIVTNHRLAQVLPDGRRFFAANAPAANPAHALGRGEWLASYGNASYNSFQLEVQQRFTKGLRYQGVFTWSRSMDNTSSTQNSQASNSPSRLLDSLDVRGNKSASGFDVRRMFSSNFTYDSPALSSLGLASKFLGEWQLSGIVSVTDGNPFTALAGFNVSQNGQSSFGDRPDLASGGNNNPILGGPDKYFDPLQFALPDAGFYGNVGRNTMISPGYANVDFSMGKLIRPLPHKEEVAVHLKFDFFNIFNRANFSIPSNTLFDAQRRRRGAAGRITETSNTARQIQLGLRITF